MGTLAYKMTDSYYCSDVNFPDIDTIESRTGHLLKDTVEYFKDITDGVKETFCTLLDQAKMYLEAVFSEADYAIEAFH